MSPPRQLRVVALGGGHGLSASLQSLRHLTEAITAVVTVADDGGSSGRLRAEFDILPPGDLRMALAALCEDTAWGHQWSAVLQHRLGGDGELAGHALGNLLIMGLWDLLPDPVRGLDLVGRLLNTRGRVLPMSSIPLDIEAQVVGADPADPDVMSVVRGQSQVAATPGRVASVRLLPEDPPACVEAVEAITLADWVILGPGSWFTSVMPHLLVPEMQRALVDTPARRILTLNVGIDEDDETQGFTAAEHLEVLSAHAPELRLDYVIADPSTVSRDRTALTEVAAGLGAELVVVPVSKMRRPNQHDTLRLAAAYRDVIFGG